MVGDANRARKLADRYRSVTRVRHARNEEVRLTPWLVEQESSLAADPLDTIEDRIWKDVVSLVPSPGIERVLARLAADGVVVGIVSNAVFSGRVLHAELVRHGLADTLSFVLSSSDIGVRKPAPEIFSAALARTGVTAREAWFVGDTVSADIIGARASGLQPILFTGHAYPGSTPSEVPTVESWSDFLILYQSA